MRRLGDPWRALGHILTALRVHASHFELAPLVTLRAADDMEQMRSVGLGMTPGDASYGEPYFYVTPWPYPASPELPPLGGDGTWHVQSWTGAVLTASRLLRAGDGAGQAARVRESFRSALPAAVRMATA